MLTSSLWNSPAMRVMAVAPTVAIMIASHPSLAAAAAAVDPDGGSRPSSQTNPALIYLVGIGFIVVLAAFAITLKLLAPRSRDTDESSEQD